MPIVSKRAPSSTRQPQPRPAATAAKLACSIMLGIGALLPLQAPAATNGVDVDVPAGGLAEALVRFAQQSGVTVVADTDKLKGLRTSGIKGRHGVEDGFNALLAGSGYVIRNTQAGYILVEAPRIDGARPATLPAVVVSAELERDEQAFRRRAEAVQARLNTVEPTVVVDRTQIEAVGDRRLSDVAARLPGTFAGGPPGEKKSINLRGVSGEFARFAFDGVALPSSSGSRNIDLQRISSFLVEDVTYLRSPSAQYEGDGIAGRLALRPRAIPDVPEYEFDIAAGGLDELSGENRSATLGYAARVGERFGIVAALGYDRYDGIKIKDEMTFSGGGGPAQNLGFAVDEREPKRTESLNLLLDLAHYHAGGEVHLRPLVVHTDVVSTGKARDRYNRAPGTFRDRTLTAGEEQIRTRGVSLEGRHTFDNGVALDGSVMTGRATSRKWSEEQTLNANLQFGSAKAERSSIDDDSRQAGVNFSIPVDALASTNLKFGVLARTATKRNDLHVYSLSESGAPNQSTAERARSENSDYRVREAYRAAYVQSETAFGRLTVTPGARFEQVRVRSEAGTGAESRREFDDVLPSLPLSYRLSDSVTLRASLARHVNRPKLDEIAPGLVTRGERTFEGNPDLLPARSRSVDIGVDYGAGDTLFGVNLFHRDIKNLIEAREVSSNSYVYDNVGDGYIRGIEFDQRFSLSSWGGGWLDGFSITANQAFLDSRVNDPLTGRRTFSEQPNFIGNLTLEYRHVPSGMRAALGLNHIAKRDIRSYEGAGTIRDKTIRAQTFVDARVERVFAGGATVYASVENLTNQKRDEYEIVEGALNRSAVVTTGRTYFVGLNWRL